MRAEEIVRKLEFFYDYIEKGKVLNYLREMNIDKKSFPFEAIYEQFKEKAEEHEKTNYKLLVSRTLAKAVEDKVLQEKELEDILFFSIQDTLLNSYLYKLNNYNLSLRDIKAVPEIMKAWSFPEKSSILESISEKRRGKSFSRASYRVKEQDGKLQSIRLLLLDEELVKLYGKNKSGVVVYPSIIEIDFERNLLHVRVRDVKNVESNEQEISVLSKRIQDKTLGYISSLSPSIEFEEISNFRSCLFRIEEDILSKERRKAEIILENFKPEVKSLVSSITSRLNISPDEITDPEERIKYAVLAVISTTLDQNELGDISAIKFRNTRVENSKKYSEVYICDKEYKGISTDELYWNNLSVLLKQEKVEFLQLVKNFSSGNIVANLSFSLDTANVKLLKKKVDTGQISEKPFSDKKYLELVDYLIPFLFPQN